MDVLTVECQTREGLCYCYEMLGNQDLDSESKVVERDSNYNTGEAVKDDRAHKGPDLKSTGSSYRKRQR